jgi:glycine hydroxymethyltransferase
VRNAAWQELFASPIDAVDPVVAALATEEAARQAASVNLIASESYAFRAAVDAEASIFVNKNATGYPGRRDVAGCDVFDRVERLAVERACRLFGAEHANVQALASTIANIAVLRALMPKGGRILSFDEKAGGHHSHGASYHVSGQDYEVAHFGIDEATGRLDLEAAQRLAERTKPDLVIAGPTAYPRAFDFRGLSEVARSAGVPLVADIAHVAGLVAAGLHDNPCAYADVVTTSTHKTLCGPRTGGVVLAKREYAETIDSALFPGLQGAPGAHIIAGRAVLFDLVGREPFRALMRAVLSNAQTLARSLAEEGVALYAGGTDTHMVVADLRRTSADGLAVERALGAYGIQANRVALPALEGAATGLRLGSVAMTIRGADGAAFRAIASAIASVLHRGPRESLDPALRRTVLDLASAHPLPDHWASNTDERWKTRRGYA